MGSPITQPVHSSRRGSGRSSVLLVLLLTATLPTVTSTRAKSVKATQGKVPTEAVLDVCVQVFDPGLGDRDPEALEAAGIYSDLRHAEARFVAVRLRDALESTGNWGAVRIVPSGETYGDLIVEGRILESTGLRLAVKVRVTDATGRVWFDKYFQHKADPRAYQQAQLPAVGPFTSFYNTIANRMLKARLKLKDRQVRAVRDVSRLRFASKLAPDTFSRYLTRDGKGRYRILGLPAADDPMMSRVERIRHRDDLLVDVVDQHFATFSWRMASSYDGWRADSYHDELALHKMRRQSRWAMIFGGFLAASSVALEVRSALEEQDADEDSNAGELEGELAEAAAIGAGVAFQHVVATDQKARMHRLSVRELAASMDAEVEPVLVEVEGRTLRLTGSKEQQFADWREMLRRFWTAEMGLNPKPDAKPVWLLETE